MIKPLPEGCYGLFINDEFLGAYDSPESAADDVYMCATGYPSWDDQLIVEEPQGLGCWEMYQ